jgi:hypothetical protein
VQRMFYKLSELADKWGKTEIDLLHWGARGSLAISACLNITESEYGRKGRFNCVFREKIFVKINTTDLLKLVIKPDPIETSKFQDSEGKEIRNYGWIELTDMWIPESIKIHIDDLLVMFEEMVRMEAEYPELSDGEILIDNRGKGITLATDYIAYPKAMEMLRRKWQATPEELAVWIILGPETGGIAAYQNAQALIPPPRFYIDDWVSEDILSPLMSSWFRRDDVERFKPADRYITGVELIERWAKHPRIRPEAFILAKIAESRLMDFHPNFGRQHGTLAGWIIHPLEAGLFALKQIERIEAEDLDTGPVLPKALVAPDQNALYAKGGRPKSPLTEAIETTFLHFRDKGDVAILRPGSIHSFLKNFKSLVNDEAQTPSFGNGNIRAYLAERIKEVKIPRAGECFVITHDRAEGSKINPGGRYSQKVIAKLLTNLRKKYSLPS